MADVRYTEITLEEEGQRLDNYLLRVLKGVPKSYVYRIIRGGEVRVNKSRAKPSAKLVAGDKIRIPPLRCAADKEVHVGDRLALRLQESIIFEDDHLIVVNKPAGIAVHGGSGLSLGVIEAMRKIRPDLAYLELVHRLDKDTSGCLLLAKKRSQLRAIQAQFELRQVEKLYWAVLAMPWVGEKKCLVDVALEKNTLSSGERFVKVSSTGKASQTMFKLLENYKQACWVEAYPKTGRTHQIRVHSAYLGHPIIGDQKYSQGHVVDGIDTLNQRLYLHARSIHFTINDKQFVFQADVDERFSNVLKQLRLRSNLRHE